jgi:signal transduction histidine kinase
MISNQEPARETRELQKRAAAAFEVAYTRFKDLQQAETQAREAVRQASLDRVRAEIASMRSTSDLQRITPLVWHELNTLGVPFIRCGVFIINEVIGITHTYLSTPEGQPLAVLNLPISEGMLTGKVVEHWREARTYIEHWNKEQFIAWMQSLIDLKQISSKDVYQGEANPPESLDLHFVPFSQGMLYVGNSSPLTNDEIQLLKSLAEAFSIAYARYEDFSQMEEAKNKVDSTLFELKQTQKQLIQSEKMASLGELTAGIAHEIQNPLNFVNNFSEVSRELVDEMEEALKANHADEAMNLANYIKENLQKIFDHGKRADAIVKGMLQHSRASAGKKEPTDINALADEYLRLSYHGLRAKDKSFNADFNTEFDESIAKIEVIPQDIGRVLLNLYNNAFYAVNEKKKTLTLKGENYEPKVWVTTKRLSTSSGPGGLEITVRDNGNGIPQKALDKIFQPFFTTKPTGQGTGLGLSLSYDIIKAHGGELKVETKEGEFTKLMIYLY